MAIKAGQILHVANSFVIDRLQTAGPGDLNIPTEKINELGNRQSVATVRSNPDLSFSLDALDVSTEIEAVLAGKNGDGGALANKVADPFGLDGVTGTKYDLASYVPLDIASPWRSTNAGTNFAAVRGVITPYLALESASYRYGLTDNGGETFTLRGDAVFYTPGHPYIAEFAGDGTATTFTFTDGIDGTHTGALVYREQGQTFYALSVQVDGVRPTRGVDYTDTATTVVFAVAPRAGAIIRVSYATGLAKDYTQAVHQGISVKPAAIKGRDIQVYVGTHDVSGTPTPSYFTGVQSATVDWRVTLDDDYEFGNARAVGRDFTDVPAVTGSIEIKPQTLDDLFAKIRAITGVAANEVIGPQSSVSLPLEIRLLNPESGGIPKGTAIPGASGGALYDYGTVLKTLYVPDARFTVPGYTGRVQTKMTNTLNFESDTGILEVFRGRRF